MTNYAYTDNVPASQNNPSVDQPKMKTNTKSIKDLIGEDHYTFGVNNGGFHKQMRIPALAAIGNVAPRIANSGTLWTQVNTSVGASTETNLHYIPGTGANDYQLTRCIAGFFSQFSTNATYGAPPFAQRIGGWSFLPGGLLIQYGKVISPVRTVTVPFPVTFSNIVFSVTTTAIMNPGGSVSSAGTCVVTAFTASDFITKSSNDVDNLGFFWMAIGK